MELDGVLSAARKSDNGALLHKVFDLARRKLQEAGADGIDKYTAKDVRKLRKVEDHTNFRDDCMSPRHGDIQRRANAALLRGLLGVAKAGN